MLRVGLTGGLASGKSTAGCFLGELGAAVFDADAVVRGLYGPGGEGTAAARELFGDEILGADGGTDRARVAALVFADPEKRRSLEARVHPLVRREIRRHFQDAEREGAKVAVAEASQILEAQTEGEYDRVVLLVAPEEVRLARWDAKGGDPEDGRRRISAQIDAEAARPRVAHVLVNDGSLAELRRQVEDLYQEWTR